METTMQRANAAPTALQPYSMYIDGKWVPASDATTFESTDPYTGKPWATLPRGKREDALRAVKPPTARSTPARGRSSPRAPVG